MELVPTRLLFDFEIPLRYCATPPRLTGELADWSDDRMLPPLCRLEGRAPYAPVYACWNETGLYVATVVTGKGRPLHCDPEQYWKSDCLRLCTDMRDTRTIKRASRYCQQFYFMPTGGGPKRDRPAAGAVPLQRAREAAPAVAAELLQVAARVTSSGYRLEAHISAAALSGFDPVEHPRIGFTYMLEDRDHGQQYLTVGDDLYWYVDPSTWATGVLAR